MKTLRAWLLKRWLTAEERALISALRAPDRWQPDNPITPEEAETFGALLKQPLLVKVDVAMINMAQQLAQRAVHSPSAEIVRAAGYAAGFRAAWEFAKSLSNIASAKAGEPEAGADTDATGLEHLNP